MRIVANRVKPGRARGFSGRRQPSRGGTSRMNREVHIRICERLWVKFPERTRQESALLFQSSSLPYTLENRVSSSESCQRGVPMSCE